MLLVAGVASLVLVACSAEPGVITGEARQSPTGAVTPRSPSTTTTTPATRRRGPTTIVRPRVVVPESAVPESTTVPVEELIDEGDAKSPRDYDDFLLLARRHPAVVVRAVPGLYGDPFEPLRGGVYAAYPERTEPIPGCGRATETTYEQIIEFAAFYCPDGDFLVYDDGEDGVLYSLTRSSARRSSASSWPTSSARDPVALRCAAS